MKIMKSTTQATQGSSDLHCSSLQPGVSLRARATEVTVALCGLESTVHYLHLQTSGAVVLCCASKRLAVVVAAVFIYSMPGYNCTIKERMLYSTCKAPLLEVAEQQIGLDIGRKV